MRNANLLPIFLGIGAQKAGTTWLDANLRNHPEIFLPPKKEIHYFDRSTAYSSPSSLSTESIFARMISKEVHNKLWRHEFEECMKHHIRQFNWQRLRWDLRYYLGRYNDDWYASLFKLGKGKVRGEITPSYSILDLKDIEHIHRLMPRLKVIYIIRNPVDRDWSAARYHIKKKGWSLDGDSAVDFQKVLKWDSVEVRGDYVKTLNQWKQYFPADQIFMGFFEDIVHNPKQILLKIFDFLQVEPSEKYITSQTFKRFNVSPQKDIPHDLKLFLAKRHYAQIQLLCEMVGGHAHEWFQDVKATIRLAEKASVS